MSEAIEPARPGAPVPPLLRIDDLEVEYVTQRGTVQSVRGVSLDVARGRTVGLVGESGSGKSVTSAAIMGLVREPGRIVGGDILWKGRSLLALGQARHARRVRGREIAIVFQDPMTSLNPLLTIGTQLTEPMRHHLGLGRRAAWDRAAELLDLVGLSSPRQRLGELPHELSGGMRQRALIAMALACEPELLIADEPTTALDVTIQAQILELLADLQRKLGLAILIITHDLGVVASVCHAVAVIYAGRIVEQGPVEALFARPAHPYTAGLLASTPRIDMAHARLSAIDGAPPDLAAPPSGCAFHPRCASASARCRETAPPLAASEGERALACWHPAGTAAQPAGAAPGMAG